MTAPAQGSFFAQASFFGFPEALRLGVCEWCAASLGAARAATRAGRFCGRKCRQAAFRARKRAQFRAAGPRRGFVYALEDPTTDAVRYVGFTTRTLALRLHMHFSEAKKSARIAGYGSRAKGAWIQGLRARGLRPEIIELEQVEAEDRASLLALLVEAEHRWFEALAGAGADLLNHQGQLVGGAA